MAALATITGYHMRHGFLVTDFAGTADLRMVDLEDILPLKPHMMTGFTDVS